MNYLIPHWLEIFGVVTSIIYLYFSINRKIWLWVLGIISSGVYVIVFYRNSLYPDMIKNVYYVIISIYGWIRWVYIDKSFNKTTHQVDVQQINRKTVYWLILTGLCVFLIIYLPVEFMPELLGIHSASIPLIDSILTTLSFIATWMLAKSYIEQWLMWIVIDATYIIVYFYKDLHLTGILFVVYTAMAVTGYCKWRKYLRSERA